jgi:hypothetical protein
MTMSAMLDVWVSHSARIVGLGVRFQLETGTEALRYRYLERCRIGRTCIFACLGIDPTTRLVLISSLALHAGPVYFPAL